MAIRKIKVSNFKSFKELEIDLRPLNVVVGGNASGKSNFLEIFRFLRDLSIHGLEDAVSLQGGIEYLANLKIGPSQPIEVEAWDDTQPGWSQHYRLAFCQAESSLQLIESHPPKMPQVRASIFDFDPKLPKRAISLAGRTNLDTDGGNLAVVLKSLLRDDHKRDRLLRLLHDALPLIIDLRVDTLGGRSSLIALKERYSEDNYLPASFLSDGTMQLLAITLALYFDEAPVTIIEEPERNIHPHLIAKLAAMMVDASSQKQVIVTTHNPELVRHTPLEDLLLIQRDEEGFSRVFRPAESQELKVFLENDLGVEDLYVQNLLGIGHGV